MTMLIRLASRNLMRQNRRTVATLAAIAVGVAGLVLTGGFVRDILAQLGEALIHSQSGHLQIAARGYFAGGAQAPERYLLADAPAMAASVAAEPEVEDAMLRVAFSGLLSNGRADLAVTVEGVEPAKETRLGTALQLSAGRDLGSHDVDAVLVGQGVADALRLAPGDRVTLLVNSRAGALNSEDVVVTGVFRSFSREYDARSVRLPLGLAQRLLMTQGVSTLVVALKETPTTEAVRSRLAERWRARPVEIKAWTELNDFYDKAVALYERQFGVLEWIVAAMVFLSVANTVNMTVFERSGEFGTMRALGNRGGVVTRLILTEYAMLGLVGAVLGAAIGALLALVVSAIGIPMPPPPGANAGYVARVRLAGVDVLAATALGFASTLLACVPAALREARTPLARALGQVR